MKTMKEYTLAEYNKIGKTIREAVESDKPLDHYIEEYNMTLVALACTIPKPPHLIVLEKMFQEREKVDLNNLKGTNPLIVAMATDNVFAIRMLISQGADFNIKFEDGRYLIHKWIDKDQYRLLEQVMKIPSVNIHVKDEEGRTCVERAEYKQLDDVYDSLSRKIRMDKMREAIGFEDDFGDIATVDKLEDLKEILNEIESVE